MIDDPIVEEIRRYRSEHAAKYGNDIHRICEALREEARRSGRKLVNRSPQKLPDQKISCVAEEPAEYTVKKREADNE